MSDDRINVPRDAEEERRENERGEPAAHGRRYIVDAELREKQTVHEEHDGIRCLGDYHGQGKAEEGFELAFISECRHAVTSMARSCNENSKGNAYACAVFNYQTRVETLSKGVNKIKRCLIAIVKGLFISLYGNKSVFYKASPAL